MDPRSPISCPFICTLLHIYLKMCMHPLTCISSSVLNILHVYVVHVFVPVQYIVYCTVSDNNNDLSVSDC